MENGETGQMKSETSRRKEDDGNGMMRINERSEQIRTNIKYGASLRGFTTTATTI